MLLSFITTNPAAMLPCGEDNDIYSPIECIIRPQDYQIISTYLVPLIPIGFELHIRPRFTLAESFQVYALPGVIHSRTKREIKVMLVNHSVVPYKVKEGDPIAQLSLSPVLTFSAIAAKEASAMSGLMEGSLHV